MLTFPSVASWVCIVSPAGSWRNSSSSIPKHFWWLSNILLRACSTPSDPGFRTLCVQIEQRRVSSEIVLALTQWRHPQRGCLAVRQNMCIYLLLHLSCCWSGDVTGELVPLLFWPFSVCLSELVRSHSEMGLWYRERQGERDEVESECEGRKRVKGVSCWSLNVCFRKINTKERRIGDNNENRTKQNKGGTKWLSEMSKIFKYDLLLSSSVSFRAAGSAGHECMSQNRPLPHSKKC